MKWPDLAYPAQVSDVAGTGNGVCQYLTYCAICTTLHQFAEGRIMPYCYYPQQQSPLPWCPLQCFSELSLCCLSELCSFFRCDFHCTHSTRGYVIMFSLISLAYIARNFPSPRVSLAFVCVQLPGAKRVPDPYCLQTSGQHLRGHWSLTPKGERGVTLTLLDKPLAFCYYESLSCTC